MSVPKPPFALDNPCSAIHDDVLYVYSSNGFASLPLKEGAQWTKLESGEALTGVSCVSAESTNPDEAGFWVLGGEGGPDSYTGVQRFAYATKKWTTIPQTDQVCKNRQWHSASYIKADNAILVYGGNQNGANAPSTDTFTIQAAEPYNVQSYSPGSPATTSPILLKWSDADTVMLGGDASNNHVYLFNPAAHWRDFGTTLTQTFTQDTKSMQAAVVDGTDGSKSLYTFDMSQSPNKVERMLVQSASGGPVYNSAPIQSRQGSKSARRDLTAGAWPDYNATLAPTSTRSGFSMAQRSNGQVVITGGNSDSPIEIFDANKNKWLNATTFFSGEKENIMDFTSSSTISARTSTTATSSSSSSTMLTSVTASTTSSSTTSVTSSAAPTETGHHEHAIGSKGILGITLGTILGFLLLLGLVMFCLKRRKRALRNKAVNSSHGPQSSQTWSKEKDTFSAADTMMQSRLHAPRGHKTQASAESHTSTAILMGRMGDGKSGQAPNQPFDSRRSSAESVQRLFKSTISKPIPQINNNPLLQSNETDGAASGRSLTQNGQPRNAPRAEGGETRRSSGWNRYWSGGSALQILGFGSGKRKSSESDQSSRYSDMSQTQNNSNNSSSNNMNPRVTQDSATVPPLSFRDRPNMSRVMSGSPVVSQYSSRVPEGLVGKIERPVSRGSSGYSSGVPESVQEAWDPTTADKPWGSERAPSSAYAPSFQLPSEHQQGLRSTPPSGISHQPQLAMANQSSDMSWLNLGDQQQR